MRTNGGGAFASVGPLFAGLIALANQQGAEQGNPSVEFLNPAICEIAEGPLYGKCSHDIISGNNAWTNSAVGTSSQGLYYGATGYDLYTGWGTAAGSALLSSLVSNCHAQVQPLSRLSAK